MSKITASVKGAAGSVQESLGKIFNSEDMIIKGEQKQLEAHEQRLAAEEKCANRYFSTKATTINGIGVPVEDKIEKYHGNALQDTSQFPDLATHRKHATGDLQLPKFADTTAIPGRKEISLPIEEKKEYKSNEKGSKRKGES